jgi:uncharacterized membrane protein
MSRGELAWETVRRSRIAVLLGLLVSLGLGTVVIAVRGHDTDAILRQGAFFVALLSSGLLAGLFLGTQLGQLGVQEKLEQRDFVLLKSRFELEVGSIMPPALVGTTLSPALVLVALRDPSRPAFQLAALSLALWIAATIVTIVYNVPVNKAATTWTADSPPPDWERQRARWHRGQSIRVMLCIPGFAALLAASFFEL